MKVFRFTYRLSLVDLFYDNYSQFLVENNTFTDMYFDKNQELQKNNATLCCREGQWCLKLKGNRVIEDLKEIVDQLKTLLQNTNPKQEHPLFFFNTNDVISTIFTNRLEIRDKQRRAKWKLDSVMIPGHGWLSIGEFECKSLESLASFKQLHKHVIRQDVRKLDLFLRKDFLEGEISETPTQLFWKTPAKIQKEPSPKVDALKFSDIRVISNGTAANATMDLRNLGNTKARSPSHRIQVNVEMSVCLAPFLERKLSTERKKRVKGNLLKEVQQEVAKELKSTRIPFDSALTEGEWDLESTRIPYEAIFPEEEEEQHEEQQEQDKEWTWESARIPYEAIFPEEEEEQEQHKEQQGQEEWDLESTRIPYEAIFPEEEEEEEQEQEWTWESARIPYEAIFPEEEQHEEAQGDWSTRISPAQTESSLLKDCYAV